MAILWIQSDGLLECLSSLLKLVLILVGLRFAVESLGVGGVGLDGGVSGLDSLLVLLLLVVAEGQVCVHDG